MRSRAGEPEDLVATVAGRTEPSLVLLTGPRGAGKSRWCEQVAGVGRAAGLDVAGLVSPALVEAGTKTAIDLLDLSSGARRRLADRPPPGTPGTAGLGWRFRPETLAWGNQVLERTGPCDLLVIDELGPLELRDGGGLASGFTALAVRRYRLAVVVVRPELLGEAHRRCSPIAEVFELRAAVADEVRGG